MEVLGVFPEDIWLISVQISLLLIYSVPQAGEGQPPRLSFRTLWTNSARRHGSHIPIARAQRSVFVLVISPADA